MFRIMRLIVMFDLPTETAANRKHYTRFRKFLIKNGYNMLQYSVYCKIILNQSVLKLHKHKLIKNAPPKGYIENLVITEKQFANMETIIGSKNRTVQENSTERLIEL